MKKKENFCIKVHESKFYETFPGPLFKSFPTIPLIPPVVASDPATEFCPFCITLLESKTANSKILGGVNFFVLHQISSILLLSILDFYNTEINNSTLPVNFENNTDSGFSLFS